MSITKKAQDQLIKFLFGKSFVPRGLFELNQYFRLYDPINFKNEKGKDGMIVAVSTNFRYGSIVTSGKDLKTLDENVKDAILTSFDIPSSFAKEAKIYKTSDRQEEYALA
ncbi:MAG: hypothetical protein WCV83_01890 [Candidatus Magasanikbacteria bacterium]